MGITYTAATAAAATGSSGSSTFIILIIVFIGLIYFMAIRPGRNRQKKVAQQQNTVRPGARVRTTAGMYATVVAVDGDDVVLEVAPDVEVRYMKRAIMEVLSPGDEPAEDEAETEGAEAEHEDDASAEHEDDLHGEYGTGAGHDTVPPAGAEHQTGPDPSAPAPSYGDDLTINGQREATGNGSGPGIKPESPASKE
jgi:preprotein translocase subunit YajC